VWRLTMRRRIKQRKHARLKTKLGLPELEQSTAAMLVTLRSLKSQPRYQHSINEFVVCFCSAPSPSNPPSPTH
jgi:hypothetical protein